MKISIIVPMYNSIKTIEKLIQSIECQTYKNYELILVDDGSTDGTYEYVCKIIKDRENMHVYKKENSGPGLTRKYGFDRSNGDLLFFVDSDDWVTNKDVFKNIVDIFNNDIDILFFDREDINNDKIEIIKGFNNLKSGIHTFDELNGIIRPGLGAKIFKKDLFTSELFYDSKMYEDLFSTYMYLNKCKNFYYEDKCFYTIYHEADTNSLTCYLSKEMFKQSIDILLYLYNVIENEKLKMTLEYRMVYLFYIYLRNKEYHEKIIDSKIKEIVRVIASKNINYIPEYESEKKVLIKKVFIKIMIIYYSFK